MPVLNLFLIASLLLPGAVFAADEITLTPEYLHGSWSLNGEAGCDASDANLVLLRVNGTLQVSRGEQVERVGFWRVAENSIIANTLTAPAHREDYHPFFRDTYRYEFVTPRVVSVESDSFTVAIGSDLEKEKRLVVLKRCP